MRWVVLTLVTGGGVLAAFFAIRSRLGRRTDVGPLSNEWVAHHRADSSDI